MVFEIGVNLRVTECLDKGDRNYMEDFSKCYFEKVNGSIVFGFFGIFDGHGGSEAASFAKNNLIHEIKKVPQFWSENDDEVLSAIKQGFINTHQLMWNERENWSKTLSGFESTAGTTATIAIVRNRKLYIGHVGDSACVLGYSKMIVARTDTWEPICLTVEHKPSNSIEKKRIEKYGGLLAKKSGVQRVVWNRPKLNNTQQDLLEGDSTEYEQIPFLAITRSLGDLWSYDSNQGIYHISPEPDVQCISLDSLEHRCLILGSDGLWNVVSDEAAIEIVRICERETERRVFLDPNINSSFFYNPAASLVKYSISQWKRRHIRADNVSALVVMIDPPGPSMTKRREDRRKSNFIALDILSCLICDIPSNENFSKQLSKEFLIECNKWRSANESKPDNESEKTSISQSKLTNESYVERSDSPCLTTSNLCRKPSEININSTVISKNGFEMQAANSDLLLQTAIITDQSYLNFCTSWINNYKVWYFLSEYFLSNDLSTEYDIKKFLDTVNPNLSGEILRIMPWIYTAKTAFKPNSQIHMSLGKVPLFSDFWLELYCNNIKPLEKSCQTIQLSNMQAIINVIKANILILLKQYNYYEAKPFYEKSTIQYLNKENDESNEIQLKSMKNRKNSFKKFSNNSKLKYMLNSEQKNRITKLTRLVQSDKKRILKKESFLLKRSISDKQLIDKQSNINKFGKKLESPSDSEATYKPTDSNINYPIRRRYSAIQISNTKPNQYLLNKSNSNGTCLTEKSKSNCDVINSQINQSNSILPGNNSKVIFIANFNENTNIIIQNLR